MNIAPTDWTKLRTWIIQKYGNVDADVIRIKSDAIKQEPKKRVKNYYEWLNKLFQRGQIQDAACRRRILAKVRPKIRKLCVVRTYIDIEEVVVVVVEIECVLGELEGTPYEPMKEEQDETMFGESTIDSQLHVLNEILINSFRKG